MDISDELQPVLALLPEAVSQLRQLGGSGRPWFVAYGARQVVLRSNDPVRFRALGFSPEIARASIDWLHEFLRDLATAGFVAPEPVPDLQGNSVAVIRGVIWELVSFVPGTAMGWSEVEIYEAGRALARFHECSATTPRRAQRPGSLPLNESRPSHAQAQPVLEHFQRELVEVVAESAPRGVIHGDATQSNVVIEDRGAFHLVDFALAYQDVLLADLGSALWRNGRATPDAITYDPIRVRQFVRGYVAIRQQPVASGRAIVAYMQGRGLQLQHRLELRQGSDPTVVQRLVAIHRQRDELQEAAAAAIRDVS
jgi:Ser/Thr protein kinase RdoA (MazF antagonist)